MASHPVIDGHLALLADHLPDPVVNELADGLLETWERLVASGLPKDDAARAAITDFGDHEQTIDAFVAQAPGHRTAVLLLFTAPVVAVCWAASLLTARAWTWPVPLPVAAGLGVVLIAAIAALITSATSRHNYGRTRLGTAGGVGVLLLDTGVLAIVAIAAPVFVWPIAAAIAVSLARVTLTLRSLFGAYAH